MADTDSEERRSAEAAPSAVPRLFPAGRDLITRFFLAADEEFGLRRRDFIPIAIVFALVISWVSVRGRQPPVGLFPRPLRVGIVQWPGYAGGLVANNGLKVNMDSDFWKKYGLLVEFVLEEDDDKLRQEFKNGEIDIMWSTVDSLARHLPKLQEQGVDARAIMQVDWSRGGDAIVSKFEITRIEELKGKKVAVPKSASPWLLEYSLEHSRLNEVERGQIIRREAKGSPDALKLFVDREVDAAVLWEPDVTEALHNRNGARRLVDTSAAANLIADVMVAKKELITNYPKVIRAFIEGWLVDGTKKAIKDPMLAAKVLQGEPTFEKLGEEETRVLLTRVKLATLDDNVIMFGFSNGNIFFDDIFNEASDVWLKRKLTKTTTTAEKAREIDILKEVCNAAKLSSLTTGSCDQDFKTSVLSVEFPRGQTDLTIESRRVLDDQRVPLLLRTFSEARFCVEASPDDAGDSHGALDISRARADSVIRYLTEHYGRPWSQFVSTSSTTPEITSDGRVTQYIRLKVIGASVLDKNTSLLRSPEKPEEGGGP
ncbi:MAG TPA: ABC transporter substrate-binding protein [Pyrinomonadaceae bacterium]|nr:ABC transporter substrate-binding protein [Pyrinomonadaceae bacterium]